MTLGVILSAQQKSKLRTTDDQFVENRDLVFGKSDPKAKVTVYTYDEGLFDLVTW